MHGNVQPSASRLLKRKAGQRSILADLPQPGEKWSPRRKAQVVAAVRAGLLDLEQACDRYMLTVEEFLSWQEAIEQEGLAGLSTRRRDERRQASRRKVDAPGEVRWRAGAAVACTITDIGAGGARLELQMAMPLPDFCELYCAGSGRSAWVRVVWQRGRTAGICFETALPVPLLRDSRLAEWLLGEC